MIDKATQIIEKYKKNLDYLEIRLEENESTLIKFLGKSLDNLSTTKSIGGYVRGCYKEAWGFCSFNDLEKLEQYAQDAQEAAITTGRLSNKKTTLGQQASTKYISPIKVAGKDPRIIPLNKKVELFKHYNDIMLSSSNKITSTNTRYFEKVQKVTFTNSEGTYIEQGWIDMEARFSSTSQKDGKIEVSQETLGSRYGFEDLENLDKKILDTAKRAEEQLDLKPPKGGTYTIVIDPILSGLFVHEAFGHLSEGDFIFDNPKMQEFMVLGRKFGKKFLNILDSAQIPNHRGSFLFDDEGTPSQDTYLIKDGILVGRLHSRETAGELNEKPTGNARCLDYRYPPIVRMTNTWIEPQNNTPEDLIKDIKLGIWAGNWLGGQTNGEMFTFRSGEAQMIRNGKLCEKLKGINLTGNVFQTLADIEGIANDMYWDESGGCGKSGQSGLPVGVGGPSIRIRNVVVPGD